MKNSGTLIATIFFLLLIFSCTTKPSEMIIGEWKVADIAFSTEISDELKQAQQESLNIMKSSSSLVIKADGTYKYTISEESTEGKWALSSDDETLTLTYPDGQQEVSKIVELTEEKLVTSTMINEIENTITFQKQSENKK